MENLLKTIKFYKKKMIKTNEPYKHKSYNYPTTDLHHRMSLHIKNLCFVLPKKDLERNTSCRLQLIAPLDESLATESNSVFFTLFLQFIPGQLHSGLILLGPSKLGMKLLMSSAVFTLPSLAVRLNKQKAKKSTTNEVLWWSTI